MELLRDVLINFLITKIVYTLLINGVVNYFFFKLDSLILKFIIVLYNNLKTGC